MAQGEHFLIRHAPDSVRDCACPTGGRVCGQATSLPAIHLREEPDALMSARPGPSGGYHASGIPTGFVYTQKELNATNVVAGYRLAAFGLVRTADISSTLSEALLPR